MTETTASPPRSTRQRLGSATNPVLVLLILILAVWSIVAMDIQNASLTRAWDGFGFLFDASIPPDTGVLSIGLRGLEETLYIAYIGTLAGVVLSLPVSLLASRNLFPWYLSTPARWVLAGLRVLPSILWAVIFVILVGTGPLAGTLAITLYTVGFVGKLEYEAFEGLDAGPMQAVSTLGASRGQVLRFVVLPQAVNAIISQAMFMFEYNVRHAAAIGIVGAGGIGYYIMGYLEFFAYDKALVLLAIIFVVVILIDELSYRLRAYFLGEQNGGITR